MTEVTDVLVQELEKNLKITCEQFIMAVTKLAVEPMLSFITKVVTIANNPVQDFSAAFATPDRLSFQSFLDSF